MAKFRKKPIAVEATQWFKLGDLETIVRRYDDAGRGQIPCQKCHNMLATHGWVDTLEGGHIVCPGDWIMTGVDGEHYPCKPDIFTKTYEPVPEG